MYLPGLEEVPRSLLRRWFLGVDEARDGVGVERVAVAQLSETPSRRRRLRWRALLTLGVAYYFQNSSRDHSTLWFSKKVALHALRNRFTQQLEARFL